MAAPLKKKPKKLLPITEEALREAGFMIVENPKPQKYTKILANNKFTMLEDFMLVRRFYFVNYGIDIHALELLFKLYALEYFTIGDFNELPRQFTWARIDAMMEKDWIKMFAKGEVRKKDIYVLSPTAKILVENFHRMLSGEKIIPTTVAKNKMADKSTNTVTDRVAMKLIRLRANAEVSDEKKSLYQ